MKTTLRHPIADLHCDLLSHLVRTPDASPFDPEVRCAIPQLKAGHVKLQTMAIFTQTQPGSSQSGMHQAERFKTLPGSHSDLFETLTTPDQLNTILLTDKISIIPAIENASSFAEEDEHLDIVLSRLITTQKAIGKFLYVSLTWNSENRFGGGASTSIGLKPDGKRLIDYLAEHHIAIDFSHTSDPLAYEILDYLDKNSLKIPVLASHSNMRAIKDHRRNLSDDLVQEIIKRGGIIGMNFVKIFIDEESPHYFAHHLQHLFKLSGELHTCFGADFFNELDLPPEFRHVGGSFFEDYGNASTYQDLLGLLRKHLPIKEDVLVNIAWNNLTNYLRAHYF